MRLGLGLHFLSGQGSSKTLASWNQQLHFTCTVKKIPFNISSSGDKQRPETQMRKGRVTVNYSAVKNESVQGVGVVFPD